MSSRLRLVTTRSAPAFASARAKYWPRPRLAPVTMATRPVRSKRLSGTCGLDGWPGDCRTSFGAAGVGIAGFLLGRFAVGRLMTRSEGGLLSAGWVRGRVLALTSAALLPRARR